MFSALSVITSLSLFILCLNCYFYYHIVVTGVRLRDSRGVAQVRYITGNKILRILKKKGINTIV